LKRFVREPGNKAQEEAVCHLAACATMERGFRSDELDRAVEEELAALRYQWPGGAGDLAAVMRFALPGWRLAVAPIEPDFVGEALVLVTLARPEGDGDARWKKWCAVVERCSRRDRIATPATLLHAFQNFGHQPGYGEPLLAATDALIRAGLADSEPGFLLGIENAMPKDTVELLDRAMEVTRHLCERFKTAMHTGRDELRPEVARLANNLAKRLSELGRREDALAPAQESVEMYRAQARRNPDAFEPDLAGSLNNLANHLSNLGRREEALAPAQEAVELYSALAVRNPDAFQPDLAMSLNNLATFLSELGRREEALAIAQEAVELRRALALRNPDAYQPNLATSLGSASRVLTGLGRTQEAAVALAEGIKTLLPQFARLPRAFAPLMHALLLDYIAAAKAAQMEPDVELLAPVIEVFEKLGAEEAAGGSEGTGQKG